MRPPRDTTRERILCQGGPKIGKSTAAMSIARWLEKTGSEATVWWGDSDSAYFDMIEDYEPGNVQMRELVKWEDYSDFAREVTSSGRDNDWVVVDKADAAWKEVRKWYAESVRGVDPTEDLITKARRGLKGWDLHADTNWEVVNAAYDQFIQPLVTYDSSLPKLHLFLITEEQEVGKDASGQVKREAARMGGMVPRGQKALPYQVRTVVRIEDTARGRAFSTLERFGRKDVQRVVFEDFCADYLMGVAGWTLK